MEVITGGPTGSRGRRVAIMAVIMAAVVGVLDALVTGMEDGVVARVHAVDLAVACAADSVEAVCAEVAAVAGVVVVEGVNFLECVKPSALIE